MNDSRQPKGTPAGGQFAASAHPEAEVSLGASQYPRDTPRQVFDWDGGPVTLSPGIVDSEALYAYTNGQNLALATQVAKRNGWRMLVEVNDAGAPTERIGHAYAISDDDYVIDIGGASRFYAEDYTDPDAGEPTDVIWDEESEARYEIVAADKVDERLVEFEAKCGSPQDFETADLFVQATIDEYEYDKQRLRETYPGSHPQP